LDFLAELPEQPRAIPVRFEERDCFCGDLAVCVLFIARAEGCATAGIPAASMPATAPRTTND
jgi:hypothetical protein